MHSTRNTRRQILRAGALGLGASVGLPFAGPGGFQLFAAGTARYSDRCVELIRDNLVIDMLSVIGMARAMEAFSTNGNPFDLSAEDIRKARTSGINVFHPAVGLGGTSAYEDVLSFLGMMNGFIADHSDDFMRIDSISDLDGLLKSGKTGIIPGIQNSEHFRTVDDVDFFYQLGQRVSQLTYNSRNLIGNGATERVDGGISDFGVRIIERMNKLGMAVDVSHCGRRTTLDAFEISARPVLITHSNCQALNNGHPRSKSDEEIKVMAGQGGVMGITGVRNFVSNTEPTTIENYLDHVDHVVKLTGVEHVGVGMDADLDGYDDLPPPMLSALKGGYKGSYGFRDKLDIEGLDHPRKLYDLTEGLIRRGYDDREISLIIGGNFRRVLGNIWLS